MNPLFAQVLGYAVVVALIVVVISFLQRGFFFKYFRVRGSLGRLVLIKVRNINIDTYTVGSIDADILKFKLNKEEHSICIKDRNVFYRSIGIIWVDFDSATNGLVKPDFTGVEGFDAVKYNNLYLRALYKPAITDNVNKILMGLMVVGIILTVVILIMTIKNADAINNIKMAGLVVAGTI